MRIYSVETPYRSMHKRFVWQQMDLIYPDHELSFETDPDASLEQKERSMREHDAMIVEFDRPDPQVESLITKAHLLGKGVLMFIPRQANPDILLPTFAPHPRKAEDRNRPLHAYWLNRRDDIGNEITVHSGDMRPMKLKIWLASQAMRLGESRPSTEDFQVELSNYKRYGMEADQLPLLED